MAKLKRFGRKALDFIRTPVELDPRITILEGSIRSSKTFAMLAKLLPLCRYQVDGSRVITGNSKGSIYRNVLHDLFSVIGKRNYRYNRNSGELWLFGVLWFVIGAKDERAEETIRGMTIGIAYSDETVLLPRSFFLQLLARMSPAGARLYCTTNPDNPYHFLKAEYMDNPELNAGVPWTKATEAPETRGSLRVIHFTLDDNPNLDRAARQMYEKMYTGVFYLRMILGLWVIAEGAIYRDVWPKVLMYTEAERPLGLRMRGGHQRRYITIDYGTTNPTVFLDIYDTGRRHYVDREYYWDSKKEMRSKTDAEYADDLQKFIADGSPEMPIVVIDPSAASFIAELRKRGVPVMEADNEVLDGIRMTMTLVNSGALAVCDTCVMFAREMQTYAWNDKAANKTGEEAPVKQHDHAPDAFRYYVKTMIPEWRLAA